MIRSAFFLGDDQRRGIGQRDETGGGAVTAGPAQSALAPAGNIIRAAANSAAVSALLARKSRRVKSLREAPVPMRFVIVVSGLARLGTRAVDCVFGQNKKAAGQVIASGTPGSRGDLSGGFACGARHWTPVPWPETGLVIPKQEPCQFRDTGKSATKSVTQPDHGASRHGPGRSKIGHPGERRA